MAKKTYSDKLKNPSWQKKRLEVLEYANWRCQICGNKDSELHVHHSFYEKGKKPWEYDKSMMIAICNECHEKYHKSKEKKENKNQEDLQFRKKLDSIQEILSDCLINLYILNNNDGKIGICGYLIKTIEDTYFNFLRMNICTKSMIEKHWGKNQ